MIKEIVENVRNPKNEAELSELQKAYREYFTCWLKKYNVGSPAELDEAKMKEFFNDVSSNWDNGKGAAKNSPCD